MKPQTRRLQIDATRADEQGRIPCVISTEYPVPREYGNEVLRHTGDSVDLSRAPLSLIESHDNGRLNIGLVEDLKVTGGRLRGFIRFGNSTRAKELLHDVLDGIVRNLSVGYSIEDYIERDDGIEVIRWTPFEVSLVSIPADPNAGLYRGQLTMNTDQLRENPKLTRSERKAQRSESEIREQALEEERERVTEIEAIAKRFNKEELALRYIKEGRSLDDFREMILASIDQRQSTTSSVVPIPIDFASNDGSDNFGFRSGDLDGYSMFRGLEALASGNWNEAGLEYEVSKHIEKVRGRKPQGMFVPEQHLVRMATRTVGKVTPTTKGTAMVGVEHMPQMFVDILRNFSVITALGPTVINNQTQDVSIPRQTGSSSTSWLAEDDAISDSDIDTDSITMTPKTVATGVAITRRVLKQALPDIESVVINDISQNIATEIDKQSLQGNGLLNKPTGILNLSINALIPGTTTYADMVNMLSELGADNTDRGNLAYVTTPTIRGTLMTTEKITNGGEPIWTHRPGEMVVGDIAGFPAYATNNMPAGTVLLGKWSDLILCFWGSLDVMPDPYTQGAKGNLIIRAFQDVDVAVRHADSFCKST